MQTMTSNEGFEVVDVHANNIFTDKLFCLKRCFNSSKCCFLTWFFGHKVLTA